MSSAWTALRACKIASSGRRGEDAGVDADARRWSYSWTCGRQTERRRGQNVCCYQSSRDGASRDDAEEEPSKFPVRLGVPLLRAW